MSTEIMGTLKRAVGEYDATEAERLARQAVAAGIHPEKALQGLLEAIAEIGDRFAKGELFLPDLIMAGEAMARAVAVLEAEIKSRAVAPRAKTLVIGTVAGDVHDIGKTLVATMFTAAGYRVIDLGINVPRERFAEAVRTYRPNLLGLSALLSSTAMEQGEVIQALIDSGLRDQVKVIVGGGAVTAEFARRIGADGYAESAAEGVAVGERLCRG